ncbi:MAG: DUF1801 domain-containing protein [Oribacterium sp.]|nr:DUF1801 domain-containing protein [Oribacterium sp.]MDY6316016.1 DUF1801 domain-containing protein [Oribacterium sp.]
MWKCPKCGRTFLKEGQSHYCGKAPATIDEYICEQPEEIQPILKATRRVLHEALPDCEEKISWSMPTYRKRVNIIHFAASKNHLGIYPGPEAIEAFADRLKEYKTSKGAIQFPYKKEIPYDLIREIANWSYKNVTSEKA